MAQGVEHFARVKIPDTLPQLVPVTAAPQNQEPQQGRSEGTGRSCGWSNWSPPTWRRFSRAWRFVEAHPFHVTRDADSDIQDLEAGDLLESVEEGVWQRRFADVVRVEIDEAMPPSVLEILVKTWNSIATTSTRSAAARCRWCGCAVSPSSTAPT